MEIKTVDSGVLEHLLEQVNKLQTELEVIIWEVIPVQHEGKPLPEVVDLYTVSYSYRDDQ